MLKMTRRWTDGPFLRWKCVKLQPKGRRSIRRAEVDFFSSSVSVMVEGTARTPREELRGGWSVGGRKVPASRFCFSRRKNFSTGRFLVVQTG